MSAFEYAWNIGIGGLLIIRTDDGPYPRSGYGGASQLVDDLPAFGISRAIAEDLLAGSPYTLADLGFAEEGSYDPNHTNVQFGTTLATTVHMENGFERRTTQARNVLGLLKGSDPLLQNELIIVGAHYDHVGTDPDGTIYNGANDNASGVAVMLEIARLWQAQGYWPARSVLFAAWDAEEQGLYGSQHYVDNPIPGYPLDQTLAYVNLDMAGLGEQVYIYGDGIVGNQLERSADALGIRVEGNYQQFPGDALPFHNTGIPTGFITLEAASGNYVDVYLHRPEDDPQKIQTDNLELIGRVATHALLSWSMAPQSTALPVTVKLTQGGEVRLPAGTPILLTLGWAATSDENVRDFLDAIHMSITLDGVQVDLANNYWGAVLAGNGGNSTSHWLYPLGVLDPGVHTIQVTGTLIQPVSDGYGTYSGVIWNLISMQIEVY